MEKDIFFKNVSFSTSHKKTPSLREFKKILPSTIIYEPILMNADIMKTQIFHKGKYDLRGH